MALPPLAGLDDLAQFTGLANVSEERKAGALVAASALVRTYTRFGRPDGWVDEDGVLLGDIPDEVVQAVIFIARRVALMPESGVTDEAAGPFSVKRDSSMWMSSTEKALLEPWANRSSYSTVGVRSVGGRWDWPSSGDYVPVAGGGDPLYFPDGG